jgi:hypothetical protein
VRFSGDFSLALHGCAWYGNDMKYKRLILPVLALMAALVQGFDASAQARADALVIIRFNQPRVYYEKPLYGAVTKAVAAKPGVMFDLVSYVPLVADPKHNAGWQATSRQNAQAVMDSLRRMGVPASRISYRAVPVRDATYDEVHLFVR